MKNIADCQLPIANLKAFDNRNTKLAIGNWQSEMLGRE
jgi:hypothetical protein